jgi:hypothetical protein
MSEPTHSAARATAYLERLAELDMAAVEKAHGALMAAEAPAEVAEMSRAYHRLARSLRQTLALTEKLARDRAQDARQAATDAETEASRLRIADDLKDERTDKICKAVARIAWDEAETPDHFEPQLKVLYAAVTHILDQPDFETVDLDQQVDEICQVAGLRPRWGRWRLLPEPDWSAHSTSAERPRQAAPPRPDTS